MKRLNWALLTAGMILTGTAFAQIPNMDPKAKVILDEISKKNKAYTSMAVDFSYTYYNKKNKTNDTQNGKITIKGQKYKLEIAKQTVFCDGKTVWTYLKDSKEVQINNMSTDDDAINPQNILSIWEKGYKCKYIKDETVGGAAVQAIDLTPIKGKKFFKVRLNIDKTKKQVHSAIVYDKTGDTYTYKITKFTPNAPVSDASFTFKSSDYPGVEVIDLR
ncbi:MAG: outer membrane lipoprotein carrier protein LolA [Bacteroidota bacterium]